MIHNLTIGHLDPRAIDERRAVAMKSLDELAVSRHLKALGRRDRSGWTLGGMPVELADGIVVCRWLVGPRRNLVAEEFALRLSRETGCGIADREHCRMVSPADLQGLSGVTHHERFLAGARRLLRVMEQGCKARSVARNGRP